MQIEQKTTGRTLYIVPTPLGNLSDITARAVQILQGVDLVACEDTRRTGGLLTHLGISKPMWSYHAHSSVMKTRRLLEALDSGKSVALVCDAGTPGLSDPGTELIQAAIGAGIPVISLPGPCAAITALVASGLPTDRFFFIGFLPRRTARARRILSRAVALESTLVIYESPYRTMDTLQLLEEIAGPDAAIVVAREMTKIFEEYIRGTLGNVLKQLQGRELKGEIVIMCHGNNHSERESEQ
jgi:16S rRNA (cytidine1402-2'-O)-methyltransferase